jgi:hypothetical protein
MAKIRQLQFRSLDAPRAIERQSGGSLGVDNIKTVITVIVTFFVDLILSINDRKFSRIIATLFGMLQYGNLIVLGKEAWNEVKDTDLVESNDLVAHFAAEFDIKDDETERIIEYAVGLIPRIYELVLDSTSVVNRAIALYEEARAEFSKDAFGYEPQDVVIAQRVKLGTSAKGQRAAA